MDVTLPDGTTVKGVPDGMTKADLVAKLNANGHDTSWYKPEAPAAPSMGQQFMKGIGNISSAPEVLANLATSGLGQVAGGFHGLGTVLTGGGLDKAVENVQNTAGALTYQPRNQAAKKAVNLLGEGMEAANTKLGDVGEAVGGNAGRTIGESALPVALTVAPVPKLVKSFRENPALTAFPKSRPEAGFVDDQGNVVPAKDVLYARQNAPKLEAHELAQKHGIVTDPSLTNPTRTNRYAVSHAGEKEVAARLAMENEPKWNKIFAADPDIDIQAPLSIDAIKARRARAAESSEKIAQLGDMGTGDYHIQQIEALRQKPTIGSKDVANKVNTRVNETLDLVRNGAKASDLLTNIQQLRQYAREMMNKSDAGPAENAAAKANLKIANILEDVVDSNLYRMADENPYGGFKELGDAYRQDRRTMAKTYAMEDAFDVNNKRVDPSKVAKMTAVDNAMTDHFADVGKIAGVFPEIAEYGARMKGMPDVHLSRYGLPGVVGGAIGGILGMAGGPAAAVGGTSMGGITGAALGELSARALRNRVTTPSVQARGVSPVPRSLWDLSDVDPLGPRRQFGEPNVRREMWTPNEPVLPSPNFPAQSRYPNWRPGGNPPPGAPPMRPSGEGTPQLPEFSAEQVMETVKRQRAQEYEAAKAADMAAQSKAEAAAAALRKPAKGGAVLGERASAGPTTTEIINESALQRAVDKLASGRAFDMTAEERIAWSKATGTIETLRKGTK